jgi:DNA-directed RNA polymerase subunit RPC12/RpoP
MTEFKFNCPKCAQRILAASDWVGRQIDCPSCKSKIAIPSPAKPAAKKSAPITPQAAKNALKLEGAPSQSSAPPSPSKNPPAKPPAKSPTQETSAKPPQKGEAKTPVAGPKPQAAPAAAPQTEKLRVAVLTPAIKGDMARAVRRRISNESAWLPGKIDGSPAYAAKVLDGKPAIVEVGNPEATRFSLIGAFLLEFQLRQVTRTASGRTRFLDQEIPDAVREVLRGEMGGEASGPRDADLPDVDVTAISHAQCLASLDVMEARYTERMEQARVEKAKKSLGNLRLADLVRKLEVKARIAPEDVATALYHEVMDLRRRLDQLENRPGGGK